MCARVWMRTHYCTVCVCVCKRGINIEITAYPYCWLILLVDSADNDN